MCRLVSCARCARLSLLCLVVVVLLLLRSTDCYCPCCYCPCYCCCSCCPSCSCCPCSLPAMLQRNRRLTQLLPPGLRTLARQSSCEHMHTDSERKQEQMSKRANKCTCMYSFSCCLRCLICAARCFWMQALLAAELCRAPGAPRVPRVLLGLVLISCFLGLRLLRRAEGSRADCVIEQRELALLPLALRRVAFALPSLAATRSRDPPA